MAEAALQSWKKRSCAISRASSSMSFTVSRATWTAVKTHDPTVPPPPVSGPFSRLSYALKSAQPTPLFLKCRLAGGI
jgi:hypothetical protein